MNSVILYNAVESDGSADELDVLNQVTSVSAALTSLGYEVASLPLTLDLSDAAAQLKRQAPSFVFNLVESIDTTGRLIYFAPALLEHLKIPFSGAGSEAMFLSTNKLLAKERLLATALPTPRWLISDMDNSSDMEGEEVKFILKPVWEDASVGIDGQAAIAGYQEARRILRQKKEVAESYFAEQYIHGREFNLSVLASRNGPQVLPAAEIEFIDYPPSQPRIVDYKAKWESDSFEYNHTVRRFDFPSDDAALIEEMRKMASQCWNAFNLHGYARVDFRVDAQNRPWILEINANPCIAPDSGFVAASEKAGLRFDQVVERIIGDIPGLT